MLQEDFALQRKARLVRQYLIMQASPHFTLRSGWSVFWDKLSPKSLQLRDPPPLRSP